MKTTLTLATALLLSCLAHAQFRTVGIHFGSSNSVNDISTQIHPEAFIKEIGYQAGIQTRFFHKKFLSHKTSLSLNSYRGSDVNHTNPTRDFSYNGKLIALTQQLELHLVRLEKITFYTHIGGTGMLLLNRTQARNNEELPVATESDFSYGLNTGGGMTASIGNFWYLGLELNYVYAQTDFLDGLQPNANDNTNDGLYSFNIQLSKRLGMGPLFNFGRGRAYCPTF